MTFLQGLIARSSASPETTFDFGDGPEPCRLVTIRTTYDPKPVPSDKFDWSAIDDDRYDGAPDSSNRNQIGYGADEWTAIRDLIAQIEDKEA